MAYENGQETSTFTSSQTRDISTMSDDELIESYMANKYSRQAVEAGILADGNVDIYATNEDTCRKALTQNGYTSAMLDDEMSMRLSMWETMASDELSESQRHILQCSQELANNGPVYSDDLTPPSVDNTPDHSKTENVREMFSGLGAGLGEMSAGQAAQRLAWDAGSFFVLKGLTNKFTGNNFLSWVVGLGGTALLRGTGTLPESFAPVVNFAKKFLPDSLQDKADQLATNLGGATPEQKHQADLNENRDVYVESSVSAVDNIAEATASDAVSSAGQHRIEDEMRENGTELAQKGVFYDIGQNGMESASAVRGSVQASIATATESFNVRMENGEDVTEDMRAYYKGMLSSLEAYSMGAEDGIYATYSDAQSRNKAIEGLSYVNCTYADEVMSNLKAANDQYQFMSMEDWIEVDSLNIKGVGTLSEYYPGYLDERHADSYSVSENEASVPVLEQNEATTLSDGDTHNSRVAEAEAVQERVLSDASRDGSGYGHSF